MNEGYVKQFLTKILENNREQQALLEAFLSGVSGESPPSTSAPISAPAPPAARMRAQDDDYSFGGFRIISDKHDPGAAASWRQLNGGDAHSQSVSDASNAQIINGGDEKLKYLVKRSDGRWMGRKTINDKRVCVYGSTQAECCKKLQSISQKRGKSPKQESLHKFALWWFETYKKGNIAKSTENNYLWTINAHLNISTPINKLTVLQLQELLNKLPATRIREEVYKLLRQILKKAFELDLIKKDISEFLEKGRISVVEKRALTLEEQRTLIEHLSDDIFSARVLFYLTTGARPAEIATVRKEEIKANYIRINGTKTKSAVRWVKVSEKSPKWSADSQKTFLYSMLNASGNDSKGFAGISG